MRTCSSVPSLDLKPGPICWDRRLPGPATATRCLWSAGFIANRREIGRETGADSDLALGLYRRFSNQAPRHIAGPFAWILWDADRQCLIAVRDRLGIQELYFSRQGDTILLAGSIESLLEASRHPHAINPRAVLAQIHGQAPVPGETFYRGISAVEPGGILEVHRDRIETRLYWQAEPGPLLELPDDASYARAFLETFLPVMVEYTPRDEVGVTLSGGLDSTTVAAAVREVSPETRITAFSWTAPELPEADESRAAESVCRKLGGRLVTLAADQHWPLRTEPGIRPGPASPLFNFYTDLWDATFRKVREHGGGVLFTGLSGDHLFGGNVFSYPDLLLTGRWWKLAREIRTQRQYSELSFARMVWRTVLAPMSTRVRRPRPVAWLGESLRRSEYRGEAFAEATELPGRLLPGRRERLRVLRDPLLSPVASALTEQAARHGVELRHPLLDHRLFEFAAALPTAQTFAAGARKVILRNAMRGRLPDEVIDRQGKTYPAAITHRGLREREQAKVWGLMTDMRAARMGFVDERRLREAYGDYLAGRNESSLFWYTLTLEAWLRRYFA